jgi:uncharacterized protein YjdB
MSLESSQNIFKSRLRFFVTVAIISLSLLCSAVNPATNPILVVASTSNYGLYIGEILRTEGFNEFQIESPTDAGITLSYLNSFDIVILGEISLNTEQIVIYTSYVSGGGNLIAIKPDRQLANIFGITDATGTLENGYLSIDATTDIGNGLLTNTLQLHCSADKYNLSTATKIATLYTDETTSTTNPGIVFNNYGLGHTIAFSYNLAKNIVYLRQGNYDDAGLEKDGISGIRATDLFTNGWLNASKNIINQADEQMRALTHCIEKLATSKKPLPRFWYFPDKLKCLVSLTSDSESNSEGEYSAMFNDIEAKGAIMTLYTLSPTLFSKTATDSWTNKGHEIAGHIDDTYEAGDPTWTNMNTALSTKIAEIQTNFGLTVKTNTNHWAIWCGRDLNGNQNFASQAMLEANNGLELDNNYLHYDTFSNQGHFLGSLGLTQGNFTGSGLLMKFADVNSNLINTYQLLCNVYDQQYFDNSDATGFYNSFKGIMDRSLNNEVYSYISIKAHYALYNFSKTAVMNMLDYANTNGIPVWTALKLLNFIKMKNEASFNNISWANNQLSFQINSSLKHTHGLTFMVPSSINGNNISNISLDGSSINYSLRSIKGTNYILCSIRGGSNYNVVISTCPGDVPVTGVTVSPISANIGINGTRQLTAAIVPDNASNKTVTWSSGNASIATINATGLVTGVAVGSTTITVTTEDGNKTATCTVSIVEAPGTYTLFTAQTPASSVISNPCELGMKFNSSQAGQITKIRYYKTSEEVGSHEGRIWSTSGTQLANAVFSDETSSGWQEATLSSPYTIDDNTTYVVSVNSNNSYTYTTNGLASMITNGPLSSIAGDNGVYINTIGSFPNNTYNNTNYFRDVTFVVSDPIPVTGVNVSPTSADIDINGTQRMTVTVLPSNATNKNVTWSSSNSTIASVSTNGLVTGVANGSATITATTQDGNYTATSAITVATIPVTSVIVSPTTATISLNKTRQLTATILPANASNKTVIWSSGNASIATINANGLVTGVAVGSTTITVTTQDGNKTDDCTVYVVESPGTYTLFTTQTPASSVISNPCELGMRFTSSQTGQIIKIHYYKTPEEVGSHVGRIWSAGGTQLASASFSDESSSGWQEATLSSPYTIDANTIYVVSVNSNNSYAYTANGLTSMITNGPLSSIAGDNGVYIYTIGSFPNNSFLNTNYFRDVTFRSVYSITASASAGGRITPSGTIAVNYSTNQTFTLTPNSGYQVADVTVDGISIGKVSSFTFNNITANHTIGVTFSVLAPTNVALNKPTTCQSFLSGNESSKANDTDGSNNSYWAAKPYPKWWKVDLGALYNLTSINIRNFVAGSRYYQYNIQVSTDDVTYSRIASKVNRNIATTNGDTYPVSATVRYIKVNITYSSANMIVQISDFKAYGTPASGLPSYSITSSSGSNGTINPSGTVTVSQSTNYTYNIIANSGYQIANVLVDGLSVGPVTSYTFNNISANHTISATFSDLSTFTITSSAGTGGIIAPSGETTVNPGVSQTYIINPGNGYEISDVTVDGGSVGKVSTYTFNNIGGNHTIAATFIPFHIITARAGENGTITPMDEVIVPQNGSRMFTFTPDAGFNIGEILVDGLPILNPSSSYTFTNVTADHTINAFFVPVFILTARAGENGTISPMDEVIVPLNGSQIFTITPDAGFQIGEVLVDGLPIDHPSSTYTFGNVTADHTINAFFLESGSKGNSIASPSIKQDPKTEAIQNETILNFYPNPFKDKFILRIDSPNDEMFDISVIGLNGSKVYLNTRIEGNTDNTFNLQLTQGIYILKVRDKERTMIQRIVKY